MAILTKEYTDIRQNTHKVEHITLTDDTRNSKEQIVEELFRILTRQNRHVPA